MASTHHTQALFLFSLSLSIEHFQLNFHKKEVFPIDTIFSLLIQFLDYS